VRVNAPVLRVPLKRLSGEAQERIFGPVGDAGQAHGFHLFRRGGLLLGGSVQPVETSLVATTRDLYRRLLAAAEGSSLYRIWNYLPDINGIRGGLENYQAFNIGRAEAFEGAFGDGYRGVLPAASALGCQGHAMVVLFAAGARPARHFENPAQVPAYEYPIAYGPRAPSFSRATAGSDGEHPLLFVSGTSAVRGHETLAEGDLAAQIGHTLENLRLIFREAGLSGRLDDPAGGSRHLKIYLRHGRDLARARAQLEGTLITPADRVIWLEADICRAGLAVEIEATFVGMAPAQ
jgi:hypothetical protein